MKKLIMFFLLIVSLILDGCGTPNAKLMEISFNNPSLPPEYNQEISMHIVPGYSAKTLNVEYKSRYPFSTNQRNVEKQGTVNDEKIFGDFEDVVSTARQATVDTTDCTGGIGYSFSLTFDDDTSIKKDAYVCGIESKKLSMKSFIEEVLQAVK